MLSIKNGTSIEPLAPEIVAKLSPVDDFYIDTHFKTDEIGPQLARIGDKVYHRFMDFIYLPDRPESLNTQDVIKICDLRLQYMDKLVVAEINERVVDEAIACAKADSPLQNSPIRALDF